MRKQILLVCSAVFLLGTVTGQEEIKVLTQSELDALKSQMPLEAETAYNEGIVAYQSKNYPLAVEKYTQAINAYADFELAYFNRGLSHAALKLQLSNVSPRSRQAQFSNQNRRRCHCQIKAPVVAALQSSFGTVFRLYSKSDNCSRNTVLA